MTGILIALVLAFLSLTALLLLARGGAAMALMPGAALMLGMAGYAWQGRPAQPGVSAVVQRKAPAHAEEMADRRRAISERLGPAAKWMVLSDGLARSGDTESAANVLVAGVRARPKDAALWVGLANALVAHGKGQLSPAAQYAFRQALELDKQGFAAGYFYGLALAQAGKLDDAKAQWQALEQRLPPGSDLQADIRAKLGVLDALIARQTAAVRGAR